MVRLDVIGMRLDYSYPLGTVLLLVPAILGAALIAAIWPAESVLRGSLVEALNTSDVVSFTSDFVIVGS